jgi:hypothetical protein
MHPHDYRLALTIARNYFERRGYADLASSRALGDAIMLMHSRGEERPLAIANKAITLLENQLQANESEQAEPFSSFPRFVFY